MRKDLLDQLAVCCNCLLRQITAIKNSLPVQADGTYNQQSPQVEALQAMTTNLLRAAEAAGHGAPVEGVLQRKQFAHEKH